ncbi:hypothetical protein MMC10_010516 [Thelotrema lepadinum]|nr:hypothetical protein [Thelotrema lepadinum]
MQYKYLFLTPFLSLASADYSQFAADLQSYYESLYEQPSVQSMWEDLATFSPSQASQLRAAEYAYATQAYTGGYYATPPPVYSAFPSPFNSFYLSAWSVESSLALKDGVITAGPTVAAGSAPASTPVSTPVSTSAVASATAAASGGASTAGSSVASSGAPSGTSSAASSAASTAASSVFSAGAAGASGISSAGAASATGMAAMGAVAGIIGAAAALL